MAEREAPEHDHSDGPSGVTERKAGYNESLRTVGKQEKGQTVGISYVSMASLRMIPLIARSIGFVFLAAMILVRYPFGWLEGFGSEFAEPGSIEASLYALSQWEAFSLLTWVAAMVIYAAYFAVSLIKNNIYMGQPGAEIHFVQHRKIVKTVKPGHMAFIVDPRVHPYAVVTTWPMVLRMPVVNGPAKDNITIRYAGSLIIRVVDSYKLLERGGFEKFLRQLADLFQSIIKDEALSYPSAEFNRFFIEPVEIATDGGQETITERMARLETSDLSVEFLTQLSEIDELNVSSLQLTESSTPSRRKIIPRLQTLADTYGIKIVDHVPSGNLTTEERQKTLALPLVSSLVRITQATETLDEIRREEREADITTKAAPKKLAVLQVKRIIREIDSINQTLQDKQNETSIVETKRSAIENIVKGRLADILSQIDALRAQIQARSIDTAGIERYMTELNTIYKDLEEKIGEIVPEVGHVVSSRMTAEEILPNIDVVERLLDGTGTNAALEKLRQQIEGEQPEAPAQAQEGDQPQTEVERVVSDIEKKVGDIKIDTIMGEIQKALNEVTAGSGITNTQYSPDAVTDLVEKIARGADVDAKVAA